MPYADPDSPEARESMLRRARRYREKYPDKVRAAVRKHKVANLEKVRRIQRESAMRWAKANPEKVKAAGRKYREANREKIRASQKSRYDSERNRKYKRAKKYGLTPEADAALGCVCGICSKILVGRDRHVDHDHLPGRVRGVLCNRCNLGLGLFDDSPNRILRAVEYLR